MHEIEAAYVLIICSLRGIAAIIKWSPAMAHI
jgi:hypothetical protein